MFVYRQNKKAPLLPALQKLILPLFCFIISLRLLIQEVAMQKKSYDMVDLTKFILSFLVVAIHVNPFGDTYNAFRFPLVRVAVPIFFLYSGFFLFRKISSSDITLHGAILKRFVKRNLLLYLFWFVALLPITFKIRHYFTPDGWLDVSKILKCFLFSTTFRASWYIMATILGVLFVYFLSRFIGNTGTLFAGAIIYILCCITSNYGNYPAFVGITNFIQNHYPAPIYNSFPAAILWVSLGKLYAENKIHTLGQKTKGVLLFFSLLLLIFERYGIARLQCSIDNDCYFLLVPVCILVFSLTLHSEVKIKYAAKLRSYSTLTYCLHASLSELFKLRFNRFGLDVSTLRDALIFYGIIVVICLLVNTAFLLLEKLSCFKWLKYAH